LAYEILGDEHTERQAAEYLQRQGHDIKLVVDVPSLGPGTDDATIRAHARNQNRLILTSDAGFLAADVDSHAGLLYQPNDQLSAYEVASIISEIAMHCDQSTIESAVYVTTEWI